MKKTFKLFAAAIAVVMLMAAIALSASAAGAARRVDPATMQPTGERVIFIKDNPTGDGSGFDANNPYIPSQHEQYDPTADYPQNHLQTAFYQATEMLMDEGGTIVICGPVHLGLKESYGSGGSTKDVFSAKWGTKKVIKFTSVYNGVDYRETAGAKITLETPAEITLLGSSIWENITIETIGTERVLSCGSCPTLIGEGFASYPADEAYKEVAANYLSVSGGHRYARGDDQIPTLTVQSGTFNKIVGGLWGVSIGKEMTNATSYVTLEGTTTVLGSVIGTIGKNTDYSGHVNININGGKYACDIYGCGPTGFTNTDATVTVTVTGGDFSEAWSVCGTAPSCNNNPPAYSELDMSGYTGDKTALAQLFAVSADFGTIKLPAGVTEAELTDIASKVTEPEETQPAPETSADVKETEAPSKETEKVNETEKVPGETEKDNSGSEPAEPNSDSLMIILIVVIIAAVVIIGGLGAVIIVMLKKKK